MENDIEVINKEKCKIIDLYTNQFKLKHSINFYDLSTGSGKSYGFFQSIKKYVDYKKENNKDEKTMFFYAAPMKSHLRHEESIKKIKSIDNIYVCRIYARSELYYSFNIDSISWYKSNTNILNILEESTSLTNKLDNYKYFNKKSIEEIGISQTKVIALSLLFRTFNKKIREIKEAYLNYQKYKSEEDNLSYINYLDVAIKNYDAYIPHFIGGIISHYKENKLKYTKTNNLEKDFLLKIISIYNPYSMIEYYDNVCFLMTNHKITTTQSYYHQQKKDGKWIQKSFSGKNLFEIISDRKEFPFKLKENDIFAKDIEIKVLLDEGDEGFSHILEQSLKIENSFYNIPQFIQSFITEFNMSYTDSTSKIYEFLNKESIQGAPGINVATPERILRTWMRDEFASLVKNEDKKSISKIISKSKELKSIFTSFNTKVEYDGRKQINAGSEIYKIIHEKLDLINVSKESLKYLIDLHQDNIKDIYMHKDLYAEYSGILSQIFYKQDTTMIFTNKKELSELYLKKKRGASTYIEISKNKNNTNNINLYEYLTIVMLFLNIIRSKGKRIKEVLNDIENNKCLNSTENLLAIKNKMNNIEYDILDLDNIKESNMDKEDFEITEEFVYEENKTIIKINNSYAYEETTSKNIIKLAFAFSVGVSSPEETILKPIKSNYPKYNVLIISATTGWENDYIFQFNMNYIKRMSEKFSFITNVNDSKLTSVIKNINHVRKKKGSIFKFEYNNLYTTNIIFDKLNQKIITLLEDEEENKLNQYKKYEIKHFIQMLSMLFNETNTRGLLGISQTTRYIKSFIKKELNKNDVLSTNKNILFKIKDSYFKNSDDLVVDCTINYQGKVETITIIFFKSKIDDKYEAFTGKNFEDEFLNTTNNKVLVFGDYKNVNKGLSFKQKINGVSKDFDTLVYSMDRYYKGLDSIKDETKDIFNLIVKMRYIIENNYNGYTMNNIKELDINNEFKKFKDDMNHISFIKDIFQGTGRIERTDSNLYSNIYINNETYQRILSSFKEIEIENEEKFKRASPLNQEIYKDYKKTYDEMTLKESIKEKIIDSQEYSNQILSNELDNILYEINNIQNKKVKFISNKIKKEVIKKWELIRDANCILNPKLYIENLEKSKYFSSEFINSIYLDESFSKINILKEDINKINYLNEKYFVSDILDSKRIYNILDMSRINKVIHASNKSKIEGDLLQKYIKGMSFLQKNKIVNPIFFQRILTATLLENILVDYINYFDNIKSDFIDDLKIYNEKDFLKYPEIFELFDTYIEKDNIIFCLDAKNWGKTYDMIGSEKTLIKLKDKKKTMEKLFPDKDIKCIYVNFVNDSIDVSKIEKEYSSCFLFEIIKSNKKSDSGYEVEISRSLRNLLIKNEIEEK